MVLSDNSTKFVTEKAYLVASNTNTSIAPPVTGKCTGNTDSSTNVDCSSESTNTQNKGASEGGSTVADCCVAPPVVAGSEETQPVAEQSTETQSQDGLDTATIVFIVLGVLLVGVLVIVILKVRKKNRKKGDKYYTIIEDQDVEQQINTLKF
tara:strand:+ start:145 stop:600 length:456 start_codon:yes stop_codon:yes gene_type:complete